MLLLPHHLKIVLFHPQIAPNTGNIARLCVATGTHLHLVRPLGFVLDDRNLRRSAMDYWPRLKLTVHDDDAAFFRATASRADGDPPPTEMGRTWYFTSKGERSLWDADFRHSDWLVFGNETHGLPDAVLGQNPGRCLRIPQVTGERCLNLATAAGIALYEALRQQIAAMPPSPTPPPVR